MARQPQTVSARDLASCVARKGARARRTEVAPGATLAEADSDRTPDEDMRVSARARREVSAQSGYQTRQAGWMRVD